MNRYSRNQRTTRRIQKRIGGDRRSIPYDELGRHRETEVPEYEEGERYTKRQLTLMGEAMLREQNLTDLSASEVPTILLWPHLRERKSREIYVSTGTPDPAIVEGMYWRTHPQGRKVNSVEQRRRNGSSYYR